MIGTLLESVLRGLTRNVAFTTPQSEDPRLTGRTYAIPFEDVWQLSLALIGGELDGWKHLEADDEEGIIRGAAGGGIDRFRSAVTVRVTLDYNAQTRVDALSASRVGRADFGLNARRLHRFFRELDRRLAEGRAASIDSLLVKPAGTTPVS